MYVYVYMYKLIYTYMNMCPGANPNMTAAHERLRWGLQALCQEITLIYFMCIYVYICSSIYIYIYIYTHKQAQNPKATAALESVRRVQAIHLICVYIYINKYIYTQVQNQRRLRRRRVHTGCRGCELCEVGPLRSTSHPRRYRECGA